MPLAAIASNACLHCGLDAPPGDLYCCAGCRAVHDAIVGAGLDRYYALAGDAVRTAHPSGRAYDELDDPGFAALNVRTRDDGLAETALLLEDVHCAACVWLTERIPHVMPGVVEVRLDIGRARADVVWDPARATLSSIARFVDSLGYPVHPFRGIDRERVRRREDRTLLVQLAVAGAAAGNVMLLAAALYAGMFGEMARSDARFFRWASMIVTVPTVLFAARPFFRGAYAALRTRAIHLDVPLTLGILVGLGSGIVNTLRDRGEIYFDSIAMVVFFLLVARVIQSRQQRRAASATEMLIALIPGVAHRLDGDDVGVDVPISSLATGDRVEIRAGETVPVDGTIAAGRSALDLGLLTGESRPVAVGPGDDVAAGTVNLAARLVVTATATGEATRLGQIARTVEDQAQRRAPIVRFADKVAARFVAIAIAIAAVTAVFGGIERALALLIVTCPCALGLATPMTFAFAIGRAARRGILIKGGDALERLARPGRILLDKTGTLTEGRMQVVAWCGDASARPLAAALEAESAHPLARALQRSSPEVSFASASIPRGGRPSPPAEPAGPPPRTGAAQQSEEPGHALTAGAIARARDVRETTGAGIEGVVDGHQVAVGSPAFIAAHAPLGALAADVDRLAADGTTPVAIAIDGRAVAIAGLADPLRPDARATLARLIAAGWSPLIVSGDDPRVVAGAARALGLDPARCRGGVTPEGKLAVVRDALATGPVAMVGDGVNDAAALAAATCGIAVHGGAEASVQVADVVVTGRADGGIAAVAEVVEGARATLRVVRRNLGLSLVYNLAGATLAITGLIHPLIAAVLMPISSLTVVSSAAWSRAFRGESR